MLPKNLQAMNDRLETLEQALSNEAELRKALKLQRDRYANALSALLIALAEWNADTSGVPGLLETAALTAVMKKRLEAVRRSDVVAEDA